MSHSKDKWVIVFLIYADFRKNVNDFGSDGLSMTEQMKAELNFMLKDILTVPLDPSRHRMYVIINSIDYKDANTLSTEAKTLLYEIGNPHQLKFNQITCCKIISTADGTLGGPNPGNPVQNPDFLKTILTKKRIAVHDDEEVFFITWDHGSAFGIFREIDPGIATIRLPIQYDLDKYPYLAEFWNKAVEKPEFNTFIGSANSFIRPGTVQIGHTFYKVDTDSFNNDFLENLMLPLARQPSLPVHVPPLLSDPLELWLVFDTDTHSFGVLDRTLLVDEQESKQVLARLDPVNVREILSNDELAAVFANWLGANEKVGVLLMMNCWMMNFHTMFSLQGTVKCLVAPQGNIGTPGYNYKNILKYLFKRKALPISPQKLAIHCVKTSENKRMRRLSKKIRTDQKDVIDQWKIFAMDLQREGKNGPILKDHLLRLNDIITRLQPENQDKNESIVLYKAMRDVCHDFSKTGSFGEECFIVDIINWLNILYDLKRRNNPLQQFPIDAETLSFAGKLIEYVRSKSTSTSLVLSMSSGKKVYSSGEAIVGFPPTGYSLFFPNSISDNRNLIDNVKKDSLLNEPSFVWREFIKSVYSEDVWKPFFGLL